MLPKKPNFFIIGAPKCGTTSLARWLSDHPAVFMSPIKEPHYYCRDLRNRSIKTRIAYESLFNKSTPTQAAIGEASTWYLYSRVAIQAIERENPGARYIVMTRSLVEMAHSLYHHNCRVLHEDRPTFEEAWKLQTERGEGRHIPNTCTEPAFLQYKAACALGSQLHRLIDKVPTQRILHISLESMRHDSRLEYCRALAFLQLEDDGRLDFPVANAARGHRFRRLQYLIRLAGELRLQLGIKRGLGIARYNEQVLPKRPLNEEFRSQLIDEFERETTLLSNLLPSL